MIGIHIVFLVKLVRAAKPETLRWSKSIVADEYFLLSEEFQRFLLVVYGRYFTRLGISFSSKEQNVIDTETKY
jgi:hypothetical protein